MRERVENILKVEGVRAKGFGIIPKVAMQDNRLSIEAKSIYAYFCSYAGAGTTAFPSVKKIISDLKVSKDRYYRHFNLLKKYGYIKTDQENIDGKFRRNIYVLVENPIEEVEEKPIHQNEETVQKPIPYFKDTQNKESEIPCPHFAYTENKDTNNNSIYKNNSNNIYINSQSINHSNNIYNKHSNIYQDKYKGNERLNDRLNKIYEKSEVDLFNDEEKDFIKRVIKDLFECKSLKVKEKTIYQKRIHKELQKLTLDTLDYALSKFKESKNFTKVNNPEKYFRVILLNSIDEARLEKIRTG